MAQEFKLPDLGEGLSEATLVDWKVKEGEIVKADQVLAEVETDKAVSELPSPFPGKIAKLHFKAGDTVPVGATVVTFDSAEAKAETAKPEREKPAATIQRDKRGATSRPAEAAPTPRREVAARVQESSKPTAPTPARKPNGAQMPAKPPAEESVKRPVLAAPATRRLARERGIDINQVRGTGPGGRVTPEDVLSYVSSGASGRSQPGLEEIPEAESAPLSESPMAFPRPMLPDFSQWGEVERQKASAIRRRIAQRMVLSLQTSASVTHIDEADITSLEESRAKAKVLAEERGIRLTLLPYIVKAVVAALKRRPIFNASYDDDKQEIVLKKYYHIGIAVDSPQGLLVPVVRNADQKSVAEIAKDIVELAELAREGKLKAEQMRGGSFTLTNIGAIGGIAFTPIINWPEVAILGLGRMQEEPALRNGQLINRKKLPLCLTFDHRIADGAEAARFVNDIKQFLENPLLLLLEQ